MRHTELTDSTNQSLSSKSMELRSSGSISLSSNHRDICDSIKHSRSIFEDPKGRVDDGEAPVEEQVVAADVARVVAGEVEHAVAAMSCPPPAGARPPRARALPLMADADLALCPPAYACT